MSKLTNHELEQIKERCNNASKGPWTYDGVHNEIHAPEGAEYLLICSELREHPGDKPCPSKPMYNADFDFIAHCRQDVPRLLAEIERLTKERDASYKFYYCESIDEYLLGSRRDNFYYAIWGPRLGWVWCMSRYLPWGQTVPFYGSEATYPSEPVEMGSADWFRGFLEMVERKRKEQT